MPAPVNIASLFNGTVDELMTAMRLGGVQSYGDDAAVIIRQAVMWARTVFYKRLGETRVNQLLAIPSVAAPTSPDQIMRAQADQLEIWLCRWRLMQDLPVLFRDKSAGSLEQWNDEAPVREVDNSALQEALDRLMAQIEDAFADIDADDSTSPGINAALFEPTHHVRKPQGSVFARPFNVFGKHPPRAGWGSGWLPDC